MHGEVDRKLQGRAAARIAQGFVEHRLDPGHTDYLGGIDRLLAKARPAKDMRRQSAIGIKPHLARAEKQPRLAQIMHLLFLLGAEIAAQP